MLLKVNTVGRYAIVSLSCLLDEIRRDDIVSLNCLLGEMSAANSNVYNSSQEIINPSSLKVGRNTESE